MAVEIPVYVDIQGAFDRAVREIPKEMPKLEKVLSRQALSIKIDMGGGSMNTVRNLLTDTTMSAGELEHALKRVRKAFDEAVVKGANKTKTSATVNNLAKAYGLLEQRVKGFYNANTVAAMRLEDNIAKVSYKINDMKSKLSSLSVGSDQYNKINYELQIQRKRLADLTLQQMQYKAGIDASTSAYHKQAGIVKQLTGYFSGLYAVHSLVRFVKQVRDVTGELEYQRVALGHLLQDADFGNELFAKTVEAAKESPFRIGQLVTYTKQLAAYRIEQENLFDTTQRLADISAGLGVDMNRLILAYGQVRAASVLRGQELRQFTEAGIPLVELLAEKFRELGREGTTTADVFKLISERAVPFEYIKEIFEDLTNAGGMFYKMQEEQAKTLKGRWEKLKDAYDQALMSLGDSSTFQSWNDTILKILNGLAKNLNGIVRVVNAASMAWAAYWVTTKSGISYGVRLTGMFIKEYGAVKTLTFGVAGLTAAFRRLWLAMKANWVGIAIGAITGLITLFTTFKNKTKEAKEELSDMERAIADMKEANKEFAYQKGIISNYESLSNITEKTATQSKQLASAVEELKRAYPELADKIGDTNVPLAEQVELLKDAAGNAHQAAVDRAKAQLNTQKELIRGYRAEKDAAKQAMETAQRRLETAQYIEAHPVVGGGSPEQLAKRTNEAAEAARKAEEAYEAAAETLAKAIRDEAELRKLAFPEEVKNAMAEWQNLLISASKYTSEGIPKLLFTDKDVQGWDSLGEAIKKLKPQFEEAKKTYDGLVNAVKEGGALVRPELTKDRDAAADTFAAWQALDALLGGLLSKKQTHGSDNRLSNLKKDIGEITNAYKKFLELRKYMSEQRALDEIGVLFPQLKGFEPTFEKTIAKLKGLLDNYNGPKDKVYLEMQRAIDTEVSNLSFDKLKETIDDKLKKVSDEIKHSEIAHNFYNNILGLTGDEDLAQSLSVSVYGGIGQDFKDRIKKELVDSLNSLDKDSLKGLDDAIREAFEKGDYEYLMKNLEKVPKELRATVKRVASDSEQYNAGIVENFIKTLQKAKTYGDKRVEIAKKSAKRIAEINAREIPQPQKDKLIKQNAIKEAEETARAQYEAFRESPMYIELFENLEGASTRMLKNMKTNLESLKEQWKNLSPRELRELQTKLDDVEKQLATRNPFKSLINSIKEYSSLSKTMSRAKADLNASTLTDQANTQKAALEVAAKNYEAIKNKEGATKEEIAAAKKALDIQAEATDKAMEQAEAAQKTANSYRIALKHIEDAANGMKEWTSYVSESLSGIGEIVSTFASDETAETFNIVSQGVEKTLGGLTQTAGSAARLLAGDFTAIPSLIKGIGETIAGIFGTAQQLKINAANKTIEEQNKLIADLEYSYGRLEKAIEKSFGSDYIANYRQQLNILRAEADAYRAQAEAERSKGKKANEDTAQEFDNSARDVEDKIREMASQVSEFMSGTDLTSAAKDFASAWIDAYKEFGNTTDAMKEKFHDMIENMVVNSLAAQLIQGILKPVFKAIDDASEDGALTAADIATISAMIPERLNMIDGSMNTLMNQLTAAGVNLRQQAGALTGISRDIAGASEESINGLAAGINTQNFYMQHIDMNVTAILAALTGGGTSAQSGTTGEFVDPYKDAMLSYAQHIPDIHVSLLDILGELRSVITLNGTKRAVEVKMS